MKNLGQRTNDLDIVVKKDLPTIDNVSITENSNNQKQTVGVIDQKTNDANKQWTGTLAQYLEMQSHDSNTFYNIIDDVFSVGSSNLKMDLIWTNQNPSSDFLSQTIKPANLSLYTWILVAYKGEKNSAGAQYTHLFKYANSLTFPLATWGYSNWRLRDCTINGNDISCSDAKNITYSNGSSSTANNYCIPIQVYGINIS